MSEKMRESLSALLDDEANELEVQRILTHIGEDDELRQTWVRYSIARSALSSHGPEHIQMDISARVREAIDNEQQEPVSVSLRERFLRPVASFAVAASVAATVVLGGQQLSQLGQADSGQTPVVASATSGVSPVGLVNSFGATTVQASYGTQSVPSLQPAARTAYKELARQRMEMYLQEHAEHAALNSPQGLIPFARVSQIKE